MSKYTMEQLQMMLMIEEALLPDVADLSKQLLKTMQALEKIYVSGISYCSENGMALDVGRVREMELIIEGATND